MAQVLITDTKLNTLAQTISNKSGATLPLTLDQMNTAVSNISAEVTPTGTISITDNGTYNVANYASADVAIPLKHIYFNKTGITPQTGDVYIYLTDETVIAASTQTRTTIPNSYDENDKQFAAATSSNLTNAYTNADSTSYAQISMSSGNGTESWIYYYFDVDDIINQLSDYTLVSISYRIKASKSGTSGEVSSCDLQFYNNSTPIGTKHNITNTSINTFTGSFDGVDWADLPNLKLKFDGVRGSTNVTYARYLRMYGADITINYTTAAEFQTTMRTQRYSGSTWENVSIGGALTSNTKFTT